MKKKYQIILLLIILILSGCVKKVEAENSQAGGELSIERASVTFVELGSVNCVPCKMMQPIMEQVEIDFGDQVDVIFYDVWTDEGEPYTRAYGIQAIPTQIFLDKEGTEYYRHLGFFPQDELYKIIEKGLAID